MLTPRTQLNHVYFEHCTFGYGARRPVFDGLDLELKPGRTVLLGPNGAGKSTLLALAASVHVPQDGSVIIDGVGASADRRSLARFRRAVAWVPQHASIFPGLTVREHVAYAGWLKGMRRAEAWGASSEALRNVDLCDLAGRSATKLSGGQTRRMQLAGALVHDARVILLDEPTAGLDPLQQMRFHEMVAALDETKTVVVSTHDVNDLSAIYSRVVVLANGEVLRDETIDDFLASAPDGLEPHRRGLAAYSQVVRAEG